MDFESWYSLKPVQICSYSFLHGSGCELEIINFLHSLAHWLTSSKGAQYHRYEDTPRYKPCHTLCYRLVEGL